MKTFRLLGFLLLLGCGDADLAKSVKAVDGAPGAPGAPGKDAVGCELVGTGQGSMTLTCNGQSVVINQTAACSYVQSSATTITLTCPGLAPVILPVASADNPNQSEARSCSLQQTRDGCTYSVCENTRQLIWRKF